MKKSFKKAMIMMLSVIMVFTCMAMPIYADEPAGLADGTYTVAGIESSLSMYHFNEETARVVVKGDDAWLITTQDNDIMARYDGMAYGPQSEILDPADATNHTLVEGTPVAAAVPVYGEDGETVTNLTYVLPVEKSVLAEAGNIYYMIKYKDGYSETHDGDYYKAKGGDYYFHGYTLGFESDSTALPGEEPGPAAIELTITNNTGMFKAVTASAVKNEDGSATLTMALSGTSYHYLYKGTYEQAAANGDKPESWIAGAENAEGKWEFVIQIAADELGKEVPIVAISQTYYDKYIAGENSVERAFYPRQINLDLEKATLVTDDYKVTKEIAVTNNIKMFKPAETAALECVGGPNSNNYKADLVLPMQSDAMSEVFVGDYAEAAAATETIAFDAEAMTFTIPVKWVETFGQPDTLVNLANGEPFHICFKSKKNGTWYERKATLSEEAGTLVFGPADADYTAVTAAQEAAVAIDRDKYTEESLAVLDEAVAAVVTGKFESQQAEVDAMAKAINDAIEALVEKGSEGGEGDVARVFGKNRYETSLKAADALLELNGEGKFDAVILASGEDYPDALAGSHLSCVFNCPILLVDKNDSRIAAVQDFIKENLKEGGTVYILGGTGVVPDKAAEGLDGYEPVRLGGANRYLTNIQILDTGLKADTTADEILVCTGMDFADSLSASAAGKPILLVGKALTQDQKDFLDDLEGDFKFTAIGGTGAVSEAVMKELEAYGTTDRVGGKNRFETSVEVAKKFYESAGSAVIAYAFDFPDGLCGGALAYSMKAPLVITNDGSIAVSAAYAEEQGIKKGVVLGGPTLISDASVRTFFRMGEDDEIIVR